MNWFLIALVAPIANAAVNHIDKHLIQKYLKGTQVGSLVLFSALFSVVAMPIVAVINPDVFRISPGDALLLIVNGALLVLAYILYFYALNQDEASFVAPLFQLVPVFGFVLGYFVLGETLSQNELLGSAIVASGMVVLSLRLGARKERVKKWMLWLMVSSSLMYASSGVLFKFVTETQQRFLPSLFWVYFGKVVFGLMLFGLIPSYRRQFLAVLRQNKLSVLGLNFLNEILALIGETAMVLATLLAPVVLVQVVSGFQPAFVLSFGVLFTIFFPKISQESLAGKDMLQKIVGITLMTIGAIVLSA